MDMNIANENSPKKFKVKIGEKIAYVEIISLKEQIYSVEFSGSEPIFITRIHGTNNEACWISIPQGNDELAALIGRFIEDQLHGTEQTLR